MMRTSFVALASGRPKRRSMLYDLHFACILIHINVYMRVSDNHAMHVKCAELTFGFSKRLQTANTNSMLYIAAHF